MRVIVCGSRYYADAAKLDSELIKLHRHRRITCIIHGGATGADTLAGEWARKHKVQIEEYPADWRRYGKFAGAIRNAEMAHKAKPNLVVAFPGGDGTANMVAIAKAAGIKVKEIPA